MHITDSLTQNLKAFPIILCKLGISLSSWVSLSLFNKLIKDCPITLGLNSCCKTTKSLFCLRTKYGLDLCFQSIACLPSNYFGLIICCVFPCNDVCFWTCGPNLVHEL